MTEVKIKQQNEEVSYSMYILHTHRRTRKLELHAPYRRRLVGLNLRHTTPLTRRRNIPVPTFVCTRASAHARTRTAANIKTLTNNTSSALAPDIVHERDRAAVAPAVGRGLPERRVVERAPAAALEVAFHVDALVRFEEPAPGRRPVQRAALHPARAHVPLHVPPARRCRVRRAAPRFSWGGQVKSTREI